MCLCSEDQDKALLCFFFFSFSLQWDYNGPDCLSLPRYSLIDNTLGDVTVLAPCIVVA